MFCEEDFDPVTELERVKEFRGREYMRKWLHAHADEYPDRSTAMLHMPAPTDADLGWPLNGTLTVHWGSGYIVIGVEGLNKLPAKQRNAIYKLGGLR